MAKSLMECRNIDQVVKLQRDNFQYKDFSILSDGYTVWLHEQAVGEAPKQSIGIPKNVFDALICRYVKPQGRRSNGTNT